MKFGAGYILKRAAPPLRQHMGNDVSGHSRRKSLMARLRILSGLLATLGLAG
ncbi:MAG TPA: hypothetical protein VMS64_24065 [Candidatus Methylomirabilis sp.]|nr:hypothetical protein [Candidatus Methylomirabilis sp.]